ncbi:MAG: DNA gyrase/topoisomerase IV subunit A [Bacteroidales bacterium]|nr:DNA gyrase/topoisomerase IV subunit A [Bacteroidales bacterium]
MSEDTNILEQNESQEQHVEGQDTQITKLGGMFKEWFLDYASYVILERAIPHLYDGLKPVQRRILHSMKRLDDGRYNKVANIIGFTMQFHPHGDASIGDALVQLGQKDLLIDMQGNWGNILTGDSAAASRYIEARLSKFALDVVFNPKTTFWSNSYDGRNKEPIALPVKFPLLLAQGAEGIAVGLSTRILPHNFNELIDASIKYLQDKDFEIYPDFITGGFVDVSKYNEGTRGGKVRIRAKIEVLDKKTLSIVELPFSKTTGMVIDSILAANEKGKIKIKKIDDNTASEVEILVHLAPGISTDQMIDALYAFTDCEISLSPNACVVEDDKPQFLSVKDMLKSSANNTVELLKRELEIRLDELESDWHKSSLERIFIENRIYHQIEDSPNWEHTISTIDKGLDPFKPLLRREVTTEDIEQLTEIKMKRITKHDAFKADEHIKSIESEMDEVKNKLAHIVEYTIDYYKEIKKKYGKGRERKTEIRDFENIEAAKVVVANEKLYVNRKEGFVGTGLKKEEFVCNCSDIDDIIAFRKDGTFVVTKVAEKNFVGKDIIHVDVFKKNDSRTIYNAIYRDGKAGFAFMKRFAVTGVTRDKEYDITKGTEGSRLLYFTANPNGESEIVKVYLKPRPKLKKLIFELDFGQLAIKGRQSQGNILSKNDVHKIVLKEKGLSTLGGRNIWFDEAVLRLNVDHRGLYLGEFLGDDKILVITKDGKYRLTNFDLTNHYPDNILRIEKYRSGRVYSVVHFDGEQEFHYLKRFEISEEDKDTLFISEHPKSSFIELSTDTKPKLELVFGGKDADKEPEEIDVDEFIAIKGSTARGKRLSTYKIKKVNWLEPIEAEVLNDDLPNEDQEESKERISSLLKSVDDDDSQMSLEI